MGYAVTGKEPRRASDGADRPSAASAHVLEPVVGDEGSKWLDDVIDSSDVMLVHHMRLGHIAI